MARDPGVESVFPLLLAEAHAHRNLVIECDGRIRLERQDAPTVLPTMPTGAVGGNRAPRNGDVDLAVLEIALDHHGRVLVNVPGLLGIENALIQELVAQ